MRIQARLLVGVMFGLMAAAATGQTGSRTTSYRCVGEEPFWSVIVEWDRAMLIQPGVRESSFSGRTGDLPHLQPPWRTWTGKSATGERLTLVGRAETCKSTMADLPEAPMGSHRVVAILPGDKVVTGCCAEAGSSIMAR